MDRRKFIKNAIYGGLALGFASGIGFYLKDTDSSEEYDTFLEYFKGDYIPNLDVHLVEHCNLKCKYCSHFSNIAEPEFYDIKQYENDLKQLKKITNGRLANILLLGGEPLLNPNICDFIRISRKYFPRSYIQVLTNGLLLNSMPYSFWQTMSDYKILLRISIYPVLTEENFQFCDKIKNLDLKTCTRFEDLGLKEFVCGYKKDDLVDTFYKREIDLKGSFNYKERFEECPMNMHARHRSTNGRLNHSCSQLNNGKIYQCFYVAGIRHFNKKFNTDVKVTEADYLDIYKAKNFDDVLNFMDKPTPFCRYCGTRVEAEPWECSSEHDISEWTYS